MLTFSVLNNVEMFAGITTFVSIWNLFALKVWAILIFSLSVFINPFNMSSIVTISDIASAITIIAGIPAPTHIIITGPNATFGSAFNITKNGWATLEINGDHHSIIAIIIPIPVPNKNPTTVS